jgi:hypothetical protein
VSEYQYYEFAAVDRPLSAKQQAELRTRSSRATITASSFVNEYHWGDLKGDPLDWVERYFDAHVYSANWGTCRLILRVPQGVLDAKMLRDYIGRPGGSASLNAFEAIHTDRHCLLDWSFNGDSGEYERFSSEADGSGWMAGLLPLRDELLRGDTRPLYLGWLARLCNDELRDDDREPPLPDGLQTLTPAQASLAEFLMLDPDWLAAAAEASPPLRIEPENRTRLDPWLSELPETDMRDALRRLLDGQGRDVERELRNRFQKWESAHASRQTTGKNRRTVADLKARRTAFHAIRLQQEQDARDAAEAQRNAERQRYLASVLRGARTAWSTIDATLQRGTGAAYDRALRDLQDLAEAHAHAGRNAAFCRDLARLMAQHGKRGAWVARLAKAGITWEPEA